MDYYMERLPYRGGPEDHYIAHWFDCLDRAVGVAALNHCGVLLTHLADGDVVLTSTTKVTFGTIREETA